MLNTPSSCSSRTSASPIANGSLLSAEDEVAYTVEHSFPLGRGLATDVLVGLRSVCGGGNGGRFAEDEDDDRGTIEWTSYGTRLLGGLCAQLGA
jgi:hypothetical protein